MKQSSGSLSSFCAARRKRSGAGFAASTSSAVRTGQSGRFEMRARSRFVCAGAPTCGDCEWDRSSLKEPEQLARPWQRVDSANHPVKKFLMCGFEPCDERLRMSKPLVPQQFWQEQTSAHTDRTMDSPLRYGESSRAQGLVPTGYMLVDAIDERSIQVEDDSGCFQDLSRRKNGDRVAPVPRF